MGIIASKQVPIFYDGLDESFHLSNPNSLVCNAHQWQRGLFFRVEGISLQELRDIRATGAKEHLNKVTCFLSANPPA